MKRTLDVVLAVCGFAVAAPILAVAAMAVWLESGAPVFHRSIRLGRGGRPFIFYKLRSMYPGAEWASRELRLLNEVDGPVFKIADDPRMTSVGRVLRRTSLDELPQLWNVLRGDMSIVGPRPPLPEEVLEYDDWQLGRLSVRPGLTCYWQIRGRSLINFEDWVRMDLEYIASRGFWTDLKIMVSTIPAVLSGRGAF